MNPRQHDLSVKLPDAVLSCPGVSSIVRVVARIRHVVPGQP